MTATHVASRRDAAVAVPPAVGTHRPAPAPPERAGPPGAAEPALSARPRVWPGSAGPLPSPRADRRQTRPSAADRAPPDDPEVTQAGPELPAGPCLRCGAVGTHYLTCPTLRLPQGYRFS